MTRDIEDLRARAAKCTTHHHACDCRELAFAETRAQLEALDYELTASPRGMTAMEALLSEREGWLSTVRKVSEARQDAGESAENSDLRVRLALATELLVEISSATEREWVEKHPAMGYVTVHIYSDQREALRAFVEAQKESTDD